jgi:Trk K+ transport system NAD-binding subunit
MKTLAALYFGMTKDRKTKRDLASLFKFLVALVALVTMHSILFHLIMSYEGQSYSWITGPYWTLTVMSTLGTGDIHYTSDLGKAFTILVIGSGIVFLMTLLPFSFISFFYAPWMEAQKAARAPTKVDPKLAGHVLLTHYGPVTAALIAKLKQYHYPYKLIVSDLQEALRLNDDLGLDVVLGDLDNPKTYIRVRAEHAALVATTSTDTVNTNVAFTVREVAKKVPIVSLAKDNASIDILKLAGCTEVLRLGEMMGQSLARRVIGNDAMTHVIDQFDDLLIAEANASKTPLVGKSLRELKLRENVGITVMGLWDRGHFETPSPDTKISAHTILILAGSRAQLDKYDELFCIYNVSDAPVVILGGGRVGRGTGRALKERGIDYRIVERLKGRVKDSSKVVLGNAAELEVLKKAGIETAPAVVVSTHDDDTNIYLTLYCRKLRPDIQIISRATLDRNVATLHRAGSDFVMSYASMGANTIFNYLKRGKTLLLAEGLDVFRVKVPAGLAGKTIKETRLREETGCTVVAVRNGSATQINPAPTLPLPEEGDVILIGDAEAENRFLSRYEVR